MAHRNSFLILVLLFTNPTFITCMMQRSTQQYAQRNIEYCIDEIDTAAHKFDWIRCKNTLNLLMFENPHALIKEFDKENSKLRRMCEQPHTISDQVKHLTILSSLGAIPGLQGLHYAYEHPLTIDGVVIGTASAVWLQVLRWYYVNQKERIEQSQRDFAQLIHNVIFRARQHVEKNKVR